MTKITIDTGTESFTFHVHTKSIQISLAGFELKEFKMTATIDDAPIVIAPSQEISAPDSPSA